ncbi:MAG: hypothetical protein BYD32DRAFT_418499 [Podila humilis]|nr:MAG: hypothetical protein BYD32DRAFT_418499 [Podila humilis]
MARLLNWVTCLLAFVLVTSAMTDCERNCASEYNSCCYGCPERGPGGTICFSACARERNHCVKAC